MKTLSMTYMSVEAALKLAKPYVGSLRKDAAIRGKSVLKCALVTEEYVYATNAHFLIRIHHNESITEPYLHHYKKYEENKDATPAQYPSTDKLNRLIPSKVNAEYVGPVDVKEMNEAAEGAYITASNNEKALKGHTSRVLIQDKGMHVQNPVPGGEFFGTGEFTYKFDMRTPIEGTMYFDYDYLRTVFKTFKQAKEEHATMYFHGTMRPIHLTAGQIEVILLPCRGGN